MVGNRRIAAGALMRFVREEQGQAAVMVAVCLVAILGLVGMAIDFGNLRYQKRQLQTAADATALAGALELSSCGSTSNCSAMQTAAQQALTEDGYSGSTLLTQCTGTPSSTGVTLTLNNGPCALGSTDPNNGSSSIVEAVVSTPVSTYFAGILGFNNVTVSARAEAAVASSRDCVYIGDGGVTMNSNDRITMGCGINVNGNFSANSNEVITAQNGITIHGTFTGGGSFTPTPVTGTPVVTDPLSYLTPPTVGTCTSLSDMSGSGNTLNPGTYCGLNVKSNSSVTLSAGTYVFEGPLNLASNTSITGLGVTLYFSAGSMNMSSNTTVDLVAPSSGTCGSSSNLAGILLWESSTNSTALTIQSNTGSTWQGAIYLPDATVTLNSNSNLAAYTIIDAYGLNENSNNAFIINADYSSLECGSPIQGTAILVQ